MPNLKLTTLSVYRTYFTAIAQSSVDIDGFKWGDVDVIKNDSRSDMPSRLLWAQPYESSKYGDKGSDNIVKTKQAKVAYFVVPESNSFTHENSAYDKAEAVIEQIMAKIMVDKSGKLVANKWDMIATNINSWTTTPVEYVFGSTKYIGCELTIDFMDNSNLEYDPSKWQ